jgi:dTDP-4-dehydrorhamnose 3,5-epimerase
MIEFDFSEKFTKKHHEISEEILTDVKLISLVAREDDRGILLKDIQSIFLPRDHKDIPMFGEHYNVINPKPMTRGFHAHKILWDYFCIVFGRAKFVLVDCRKTIDAKDNPTYGKINEFFLSDRNPYTLVVPPGVYHGWKSYVDNTILSSTGTHLYDPENLDEIRVPIDSFGYDWSIKIK